MSGTLYGVGVGPGDPELMTLRAHRLIAGARVVTYPVPDGGESFARAVAADVIPSGAEEIPIVVPMRGERSPAQLAYDAAAETIATRLTAGLDVVALCEGDPLFYGSFMYLFRRLSSYRVEIVPGVSSLSAAAAAARRPLSARNETLTVIPAPLPDVEIAARMDAGGAAAIIKVGRHLARIRRLVAMRGLEDRAFYVAHASLPGEVAVPIAEAPKVAPYFSMILVHGTDAHAHA